VDFLCHGVFLDDLFVNGGGDRGDTRVVVPRRCGCGRLRGFFFFFFIEFERMKCDVKQVHAQNHDNKKREYNAHSEQRQYAALLKHFSYCHISSNAVLLLQYLLIKKNDYFDFRIKRPFFQYIR